MKPSTKLLLELLFSRLKRIPYAKIKNRKGIALALLKGWAHQNTNGLILLTQTGYDHLIKLKIATIPFNPQGKVSDSKRKQVFAKQSKLVYGVLEKHGEQAIFQTEAHLRKAGHKIQRDAIRGRIRDQKIEGLVRPLDFKKSKKTKKDNETIIVVPRIEESQNHPDFLKGWIFYRERMRQHSIAAAALNAERKKAQAAMHVLQVQWEKHLGLVRSDHDKYDEDSDNYNWRDDPDMRLRGISE